HTFLWFVAGSSELSQQVRETVETPSNEHFLSIASLWEISIKTALGKLTIQGSYETVINDATDNGIQILPINFAHTVQQNKLPFHHRDPFDRIIVSQALVENMQLVSRDGIFDEYLKGKAVRRIW
ncbi:MAG: type II toxin-antitoxin system VapC family toxin, partial [Ferruginibacter sp.]|nr:type II toxin-antitoxin system VapC family toxin [Cytophagales bacterium]